MSPKNMSLQYTTEPPTSIPNSSTIATTTTDRKSTSSHKLSSLFTNIIWVVIVTTTTLVFSVLSWYYLYSLVTLLGTCLSTPEVCLGLQPLLTQVNTSVEILSQLPGTTAALQAELKEIKTMLKYILCFTQTTNTEVLLLCSP